VAALTSAPVAGRIDTASNASSRLAGSGVSPDRSSTAPIRSVPSRRVTR